MGNALIGKKRDFSWADKSPILQNVNIDANSNPHCVNLAALISDSLRINSKEHISPTYGSIKSVETKLEHLTSITSSDMAKYMVNEDENFLKLVYTTDDTESSTNSEFDLYDTFAHLCNFMYLFQPIAYTHVQQYDLLEIMKLSLLKHGTLGVEFLYNSNLVNATILGYKIKSKILYWIVRIPGENSAIYIPATFYSNIKTGIDCPHPDIIVNNHPLLGPFLITTDFILDSDEEDLE